jgi:IS5 family transposase
VHADKIYRNRTNRAWCTEKGIRLSGPSLGRPPKNVEVSKARRKLERQDEIDRVPVEGKFGQLKHSLGLGRVMGELAGTSATMIALAVFVANLLRRLAALLFVLILEFRGSDFYQILNKVTNGLQVLLSSRFMKFDRRLVVAESP